VNTDSISSNIIVDSGRAAPAGKIEDVRQCLGVEPPDSLFGAEVIVLVEGECDRVLLSKYIRKFHPGAKERLRTGHLAIVSTGGADKFAYMAKLYQSYAMRCVLLLDDDGAGRGSSKQLKENGVVEAKSVFHISIEGRRETEIEDLLPSQLIARSLLPYGIEPDKKFLESKSRFSKRVLELSTRTGHPLTQEEIDELKVEMSKALDAMEVAEIDLERVQALESLIAVTSRR
jgi:predicted ATP-dependent endonuclease of OLD family